MIKQSEAPITLEEINRIIAAARSARQMGKQLEPQLLAMVKDAARRIVAQMDFNFVFDPGAERMAQAIKNRVDFVVGKIDEANYAGLREVMLEGYRQGESAGQVANRIREYTGDKFKSSPEIIARTEIVAANNLASLEAYRQAGYKEKKWISSRDSKVRPTHQAAEGQTVPLDGTFAVGAGRLAFPGDHSAPIEEWINCRCTMVGVGSRQHSVGAERYNRIVEEAERTRDIAKPYQQKLEAELEELRRLFELKEKSPANQKSVKSMVDKVTRKLQAGVEDYSIRNVGDHVRGAVIVNEPNQIDDVVEELKRRGYYLSPDVGQPTSAGYRNIHFNKQVAPGLNAEVQVHTAESWEYKEKFSDALYQKWRNKTAKPMTNAEWREYQDDLAKSRAGWERIYSGGGWSAALNFVISSFVARSASWKSKGSESDVHQRPSLKNRGGLPESTGDISQNVPSANLNTLPNSIEGKGRGK